MSSERVAGSGWRAGFIAVLLIVAAVAFIQSYQRWLDPIIDTGRDLYIPEQLLNGARLYGDIRYQYPPLAPYVLAVLTSVVGHSLAAYTVIGLLQSIVQQGKKALLLATHNPAIAEACDWIHEMKDGRILASHPRGPARILHQSLRTNRDL